MLNEDPGLPVGEAEIAKKMEALLFSKYDIKDFFYYVLIRSQK